MVDRIVDEAHAVLLVGTEERELVVPLEELPEGTQAGHWLRVRLEGERVTEATIDQEATEEVRDRIAEKLERLRRRGRRRD